ncbi:hypothetical protein [Microvirga calopogonii]|uniref:hypothetical protein n=1 Tax=Microvirga calopogonii TaxID=2078013 RepID=UPI000E0DD0E9|nr:hypothetical protein [Microvirga calopogonii]
MAADVVRFQKVSKSEKFYSPDILPQLQTVLADLADIDFAYEKRLDSIRHSEADEDHKSEMIAGLQRLHCEQRAPYIQELVTLRSRIEETFA